MRDSKILLLHNCDITLVICRCPICNKVYFPEHFRNLVPLNSIYGYDVINKIGELRYLELYQDRKIQDTILEEKGFIIPLSTIGHLAKKYVDYVSTIHYSNAPLLQKHFLKYGFILTLDGTYEGDTGIHFSMRDSETGVVLYNMKIKTENEKDVKAGVEECIKLFGKPDAVVCDLSDSIRKAVKSALPDTPLLICHFHFLENVGKSLLGDYRKELAGIIKKTGIISSLAEKRKALSKAIKKYQNKNNIIPNEEEAEFKKFLDGNLEADISDAQRKLYLPLAQLNWIADYKHELNGEYYPFSIKEIAFVDKCIEAVKNLKKTFFKNKNTKDFGPIYSAYEKLKSFVRQNKLKSVYRKIKSANDIFNKTRDFFRLNSSKNSPVSRVKLTDDNKSIIENFKSKMSDFEKVLKDDSNTESAEIVLEYIEKYRENLTGHTLIHGDDEDKIIINAPRTNNIMETLFGTFKRKLRQRIGTKKLTNNFKAMHPDEFLIENLTNQKYLDIMFEGSIDNLIKQFPLFDNESKLTSEKRKKNNSCLTLKKSILRNEDFSLNITKSLKSFEKSA